MHVTVSFAIMQLEVSAALMQVTVSAWNLCVRQFLWYLCIWYFLQCLCSHYLEKKQNSNPHPLRNVREIQLSLIKISCFTYLWLKIKSIKINLLIKIWECVTKLSKNERLSWKIQWLANKQSGFLVTYLDVAGSNLASRMETSSPSNVYHWVITCLSGRSHGPSYKR